MADPTKPFSDMATRIENNLSEFGGAFVLVLPGEEFKSVNQLIVGTDPDAAILLHNAINQLQLLIEDLKRADAAARGYGR